MEETGLIYGALEAGGTKMVCAIGDETGRIIEQISVPTTTPDETMPAIIDYFKDKNIFFRIFAFLIYFLLAKPLAWLLLKIIFTTKVINKKAFKKRGKNGCFIYSNHTNYLPDALLNSIMHGGKNYIVVGI